MAQAKTDASLPLKTVRLYEAGVGYFERSGRVGKGTGLTLPVPVSHLDDALKTLVVLGTDGKTTVAGVEFASSISPELSNALAGLPQSNGAITHANLLRSLKGGAVELRTAKETLRGKLVDVLDPAEDDPGPCIAMPPPSAKPAPGAETTHCIRRSETTLLLLTNDAEIRKLFISDVVGVKPTDPALAARLSASASVSSSQGASARRDLRILADSTGEVTLGYVAEAPVWRSSYRLVLDPKSERGTLQGWALVHNDTDEEWKKVKIELVNGRPDSFLFPLASPRYTRRDLRVPAEPLSTVPQLSGTTADAMWSEAVNGNLVGASLGLSGYGEGGGGRGEGIGLGSIGTIGHGAGSGTGIDTGTSTVLEVGDLAKIAEAEGMESGALFRYSLPVPVDMRPHGSALVPFLQQSVSARRIVLFSSPGAVGRSAARLKNDTKQTLPTGTIAFFSDGGFAGEAELSRMKPGESHFLQYGDDIDVELTEQNISTTEEVQLVEVIGGALIEHFVRHRRADYVVENRSGVARTAFLQLDVVRNAAVRGSDELDFDVASAKPLAVFAAEPRSKKVRRLEIDEGLSRKTAVATLGPIALRAIAGSPKLPEAQRNLLKEAASYLTDAQARESLLPKRKSDLDEVLSDLARLRDYMARTTSKSDSELFTHRILDKEALVKELRTRIAALQTEAEGLRQRSLSTLQKLGK